jgi:hypothetical protein
MKKVALLLTILFCCAFNAIAQVQIEPRPCEFNNLILEQANREAEKDSIIILIGRLGIKDTKKDLSKKRLYTGRAYLVEYNKLRNPESVITAEAAFDGKSYYGAIEIYVNGKLLDVITSYPNAMLGLGSCAHPDTEDDKSRKREALLYPWSYKKRKR